MIEVSKRNTKYIVLIILCFFGMLCMQEIYSWICSRCLRGTINFFPDNIGQYELLIIHHTYMFLIAFIITFVIWKCIGVDFGYRMPNVMCSLKCLCTVSVIALFFSLIEGLFGLKMELNNESIVYFVFQFFFSGLGEEIIYRTIPIAAFDLLCEGKSKCIQVKKLKIDLSVVLSSALFAFSHISNHRGQALYAQIYGLLVVFTGGIVFGWIYRKTESVWSCMVAHGTSNVLMATFPILSGVIFGI